VLGGELPPQLLEAVEAQQAGIGVVAHPARVLVDHVLQARTLGSHVQQLVDLLLVLHDREPRLGVVHDVLHLPLDRVLVQRDGHAPERLGGEHRPVELGPVVADDGDLVATREAERGQPERDEPRLVHVAPPGVGLPDAVVLLADRHLVRDAPGVVDGELRKGVSLCLADRRGMGGAGKGAAERRSHQVVAILPW
jgi:hypothetical protein